MNRTLILSGVVLAVVLVVTLVGFAPSTGVTTDPEISAILSNVDSSRILNTAQTMQNFRTRQSSRTNLSPARA
jgi:hypothetical protein